MTLGTEAAGTSIIDPMIPKSPIPSNLSNPLIIVCCISDTGWKDHADLDLTINNSSTWHKWVVMVLQLCSSLDLYLVGKTVDPDTTLEPCAHKNWLINDATVCAFIKTRCSSMELTFIEDCPTAFSAWTTLQTCHQCQEMVSQIHLMQEAFMIKYSMSTPFLDTSEHLHTLNDHI